MRSNYQSAAVLDASSEMTPSENFHSNEHLILSDPKDRGELSRRSVLS